jgi:putative sporulation protein YtaF
MLGFALSLDSFGAGIGAAMLGFSPYYLALTVAIMSSLFVLLGLKCGAFFHRFEWIQKFTFLPGILLMMIGIWKIL